MRVVATADTHFPFTADKVPDGDVFIHAGDLMYDGYPDEWKARVDSLAALPHKHKYLIPGNHDFHIHNYEGIARAQLRRQANVKLVGLGRDTAVTLPNKMKMLGIPYVTNIQGWAWNVDETWLEEYLNRLAPTYDVVVSHAPVFGVLDAVRPTAERARDREHIGGLAVNKWFHSREVKPKAWVCGHIHESYGHTKVEGTDFFNVAMCDAMYAQTNQPKVFDL